jgi:replicative DNA helicase
MADIELEVLSRAVMTGGIDQLIGAGVEGRHFFDPVTRAVYQTCVEHFAVWRKPLSLEGIKRHHPGYQVIPATDDLSYLIHQFRIDRGVKIGTSAALDLHQLIAQAEDPNDPGHKDARENFIDRFMEVARRVAAESPTENTSRFSDMADRVATIRAQQEAGEVPGVSTGVDQIEPYVRYIRTGEFFVHCGFSGRGKTQSLVRCSIPAYEAGDVVLMNSLEMGPDEIWEMYDAHAARLSRKAISRRELGHDDYQKYEEAAAGVRAARNDKV